MHLSPQLKREMIAFVAVTNGNRNSKERTAMPWKLNIKKVHFAGDVLAGLGSARN